MLGRNIQLQQYQQPESSCLAVPRSIFQAAALSPDHQRIDLDMHGFMHGWKPGPACETLDGDCILASKRMGCSMMRSQIKRTAKQLCNRTMVILCLKALGHTLN